MHTFLFEKSFVRMNLFYCAMFVKGLFWNPQCSRGLRSRAILAGGAEGRASEYSFRKGTSSEIALFKSAVNPDRVGKVYIVKPHIKDVQPKSAILFHRGDR